MSWDDIELLIEWVVSAVLIVLAIGLLVTILAPAAEAQGADCHRHDLVVERLEERYGEVLVGMGVSGDTAVVEVFANEVSGSWTITVTELGQPTCLVASGQHWQSIEALLAIPGEDT